jgi:hypothetical protein
VGDSAALSRLICGGTLSSLWDTLDVWCDFATFLEQLTNVGNSAAHFSFVGGGTLSSLCDTLNVWCDFVTCLVHPTKVGVSEICQFRFEAERYRPLGTRLKLLRK